MSTPTSELDDVIDDQHVIDKLRGIPEELYGHEDSRAEGGYTYPCRSCDEDAPILCDPTEFDPDYHYCGKNQWCCP